MTILGNYLEDGSIQRAGDGAFVPADPRNPAYQSLMESVADGGVIAPFTPHDPSGNPSDYDLFDWQLRKGLIANGYSIAAIEATILALEDQAERETRWLLWDRPTVIKWDNAATQEFIAWLGIPEPYAIDMWLAAKDYTL